jgi:mRNA-degrading endonuclease RelE of RelBE toxin-antitoxin system
MVSVAFSDKYFDSLLKLTPNEQSQANKAVMQFQQDPQHSSLHYEKLTAFKDNKLRSIRANQDVRIILAAADKDELFLMLYVDHHDASYAWASKRRVEINPSTGSLQVFTTEEAADADAAAAETSGSQPGIFDAVRDRQLLQLGVPEASIPTVRAIRIEADLEEARDDERIPRAPTMACSC